MHKFISATFYLFILLSIQARAFGQTLECKFKDSSIRGVGSIQISDESLIINRVMEIPLEKSRVKCGNFGKQTRLDGSALGFQVVLKSCTTEAKLEGYIIDSLNAIAADVLCNSI